MFNGTISNKRRRTSNFKVENAGRNLISAFEQVAREAKRATGETRTFTRTKKTTESSSSVGGADPEFSETQYVKIRKGPKRAIGRPFPTNTILNYDSTESEGNAGRLLIGQISCTTRGELITMMRKLVAQSPTSFRPADDATPITTFEDSNLQLYHLSTETMVDFTNFSNTGCHLQIYDIHPKRNTAYTPNVSWVEGTRDTQGHDAGAAEIGLSQHIVGSKPTDSVEFSRLWDIDFNRKVFLGPGDTHRHRSYHAPHKLLSAAEMNFDEDGSAPAGTGAFIHGHSRAILYSMYGAPAKIIDATVTEVDGVGTETHHVTYSATDCGIMITRKDRFSMLDFGAGGDIDVVGSLWASTTGTIREADGDEVPADTIPI